FGHFTHCAGRWSSVDLAEHRIEGTDHDDQVRDEVPGCDAFERLQIIEARRTRAYGPRTVLAVADDTVAEFAARSFDRLIHVAGRNAEPLANQFEVMDQCLHRERDRLFRRERDLRIVDHDRTRRVEAFAN